MESPVVEQLHERHHSQQTQKPEQMMHSKLRSRKHLSLENYLAFFHSRDFTFFTVDHLNTIVSIHGFKKLNKRKKSEEAVRAIELINPVRSTLQDNISSSTKATITLNEAITDLKSLKWQECSITSIKSINQQNNTIMADPPPMKVSEAKPRKEKNKKPEFASSMSCSSSGPSSNNSSSEKQNSVLPLPVETEASKGLRKPMLKRRKVTKIKAA